MEEFRIVIYDRIQDLVIQRLKTSDFIAYAAKWDTLRTLVDIALQNLKTFTSEYVASSSHKQEQLEAKMAYVASNQEVMVAQLQTVAANQDSLVNKQA